MHLINGIVTGYLNLLYNRLQFWTKAKPWFTSSVTLYIALGEYPIIYTTLHYM